MQPMLLIENNSINNTSFAIHMANSTHSVVPEQYYQRQQ